MACSCVNFKMFLMRHLMFQNKSQAIAFVKDLQAQGFTQMQMDETDLPYSPSPTPQLTNPEIRSSPIANGTPEDSAAGAVKGMGIGVVIGAVAGVAATLVSGGLAAPVILGMAALGSGVGAEVGAIGGAAGVDETGKTFPSLSSEQYDRMNSLTSSGSYALAIDNTIPQEAVIDTAARHGGEFL
jgi:hypothetical protein